MLRLCVSHISISSLLVELRAVEGTHSLPPPVLFMVTVILLPGRRIQRAARERGAGRAVRPLPAAQARGAGQPGGPAEDAGRRRRAQAGGGSRQCRRGSVALSLLCAAVECHRFEGDNLRVINLEPDQKRAQARAQQRFVLCIHGKRWSSPQRLLVLTWVKAAGHLSSNSSLSSHDPRFFYVGAGHCAAQPRHAAV
jgi:hypothetical protein